RLRPDHRTINDFRRRHLSALGGLFGQVLRLCQRAGLVKLGHVALDGTNIKANASKHKAMSYSRMKEVEPERASEVARWFAEADDIDRREDGRHASRSAWRRSARRWPRWRLRQPPRPPPVKRTGGRPRRPGRATMSVRSRPYRDLAT